jgi:hypothetical protein
MGTDQRSARNPGDAVTPDEYIRHVRYSLIDLPWSTRRELVSELRGHLDELPAGTDLTARLGPPHRYAAEMRAAAGLERRRGVLAFLRARRPRNLILTVVVLTAIGLGIGAVVWIDSYQPLGFAGAAQDPLDSKPSLGTDGVTVVFRKGHQFEYGTTIQNTGRFTVRVLGVPRSPLDFFSGRLLMSGPRNLPLTERPLVRFRPFDLKPGSIRWLVFKGVYACTTGMGGSRRLGFGSVTRDAIPVRFSFLWRTATASIPLGDPLTITFHKGCLPPAKYR